MDSNSIVTQSIELSSIHHQVTNLPQCKNFNDEYKIGSRLLSKNKELRKSKDFDLSKLSETLEFPALTNNQIKCIRDICSQTWLDLQECSKRY